MSTLITAQSIGGLIFIAVCGGFIAAYVRMWRWVIGPDGDSGGEQA
ncbi:MAG: hypothetical protein HZB13_00920 [Acidobacteria bacterium]|nr:hypothetical protein [Acidobacteriota bacterium]